MLTDFDGTLAPIVEDPQDSAPLPGVADLLAALSERYAVVAVVSGRPVSFLADRLGAALAGSRVVVAGQYGMEQAVGGGPVQVMAGAEAWRATLAEAYEAATAGAPGGLVVEDKGLGVTLHWRLAPETREWARRFAELRASSSGLEAHPGRMSLELRPPALSDKGTVTARLCAGAAAACFVGDDAGDLAAFQALDRLAQGGTYALKVAVDSSEAPRGLIESADLVLEGPQGVRRLLEQLAGVPGA